MGGGPSPSPSPSPFVPSPSASPPPSALLQSSFTGHVVKEPHHYHNRNSLLGAWALTSYRAYSLSSPTSPPLEPFGPDASGFLLYTPTHMSLHLGAYSSVPPFSSSDDPAGGTQEERARAWIGSFSYAGPYRLTWDDEDEFGGDRRGTVKHTMEVGSYPNWRGGVSERWVRIESGGKKLRLGTVEPVLIGGEKRRMELTWRRA